MKVHSYHYSKTKRFFDVVFAFILLVALAPIFFLITVAILVSSGGPVFYTQQRWGKHKQPFLLHKFRVMYVGAEKDQWRYKNHNEAPEPMYKNWQDPRYVGIGGLLSKLGLDELPQLYNIIKGEMSFIGPRPLPIKEAKQLPPEWDFRYQITPGIFSEWSASADRHASLKKWLELEKRTLRNGGILYELRTIFKTFSVLLKSWQTIVIS
jgi:lipopolysaccharide/colanic/teichoic acid biosynthesis glycosyltransferase